MTDRPQSISQIAAEHGLERWEVRTLITEHAVPTYRIGTATAVGPEHWPKLQKVVRRYRRVKLRRMGLRVSPAMAP